jgi:ATP-dependent helicase/nuclease subunit B
MIQTKVNFVLGPAGSGKTYGFIESVREHLRKAPEGRPLLFLAPKQATFQIESQLLRDDQIQGFTRLQILSFPRLAEYLLSEFAPDQSQILSDDGRIMILRSLLNRHASELKAFKSVAHSQAFTDEIGALLTDLQRHQIDAGLLKKLKARSDISTALANKLHDIELILFRYREWLDQSHLKDAEYLLDLATTQLNSLPLTTNEQTQFFIEELWLDGFGEMTPQELSLLAAIVRRSRIANLAFCVDPAEVSPSSWLSIWATTSEAYQRCEQVISQFDNVTTDLIRLGRAPDSSRFKDCPELSHLESRWSAPIPMKLEPTDQGRPIEIAHCPNRESEVTHTARQILHFVRERQTRFRQITVVVRRLEDYASEIKRVFNRYQIPYFIDQREPIGLHPAVVVTRYALKLAAFHWKTDDLMAALKTQLISRELNLINELENAAIEFGWEGSQWLRPLKQSGTHFEHLERFRQKVIRPFTELYHALTESTDSTSQQISGIRLVDAIRQFWEGIRLQDSLDQWERDEIPNEGETAPINRAIHSGTWSELQTWIDNVELAFADTHRPLRDWIPVIETGLTRLSIGVIPPTTDQVLIGSVDRTRSPNVELSFVLGLNETVFPALPSPHPLLSEPERERLGSRFQSLIPAAKRALATERFYAYIACTRATEKLIVSYADQAQDGTNLTPSSIISHILQLFPTLEISEVSAENQLSEAQHISELIQPLFHQMTQNDSVPEWARKVHSLNPEELQHSRQQSRQGTSDTLESPLPQQLYQNDAGLLRTSVSRLEQFAACPFRFFIHSGLRCEERVQFQIDRRRIGSFQHLILETFHNEIQAGHRNWRQVPPSEAQAMIARITQETAVQFDHGIFLSTAEAIFSLESIVQRLQEFVAILIEWMDQYEFDPHTVELGFGGPSDPVGPWTVALDSGRIAFMGKIDRLDVHPSEDAQGADAVIIDYKSGGKKLDPILLYNGVQLQLLAYLNVVSRLPEIGEHLKTGPLYPAGVFFVPLRGYSPRQPNRDSARLCHTDDRPRAFQHVGCFDLSSLRQLDNRSEVLTGDQIHYQLKKNGTPKKTAWNVMAPETFRATMARTEASIQAMGNRILSGEINVDPFKHGNQLACQYCPYPTICRIDPAEHAYRTLSRPDDD